MSDRARAQAWNDAWQALHRDNATAHHEGTSHAGHPARNPYPPGSDEHYWWNEGCHNRPFAPLTDQAALTAAAVDLANNRGPASYGRDRRPRRPPHRRRGTPAQTDAP